MVLLINQQSAQTEQALTSIENANAQIVLPLKNYLGNYQNNDGLYTYHRYYGTQVHLYWFG